MIWILSSTTTGPFVFFRQMARSSLNVAAQTVIPVTPAPSPTTRTSTRVHARHASTSASNIATPVTPVISTPPEPLSPPSTSRIQSKHSGITTKSHALRSVLGEKEREPCPYPGQYGGPAKCGVTEEDEKDEVLMATCAACSSVVRPPLTGV